jgi:hypothetical protein
VKQKICGEPLGELIKRKSVLNCAIEARFVQSFYLKNDGFMRE